MPDQQGRANDLATPAEKEKAAEVESYGGVPMDDQELADVWTSGGRVESGAEPESGGAADRSETGDAEPEADGADVDADGSGLEREVAMDAPGGNEPTD